MQIIKSPQQYSSAFNEALFEITATSTEIVDVDIFDKTQSSIIGKKRFTGSNTYSVNVASYAQRQLDITPVTETVSVFTNPQGRAVEVYIEIGSIRKSTILSAALQTLPVLKRLSKSPEKRTISTTGYDEITFLLEGNSSVSAEVMLGNYKTQMPIIITAAEQMTGLVAFNLNMEDLESRLQASKRGHLSGFDTMSVKIICDKTPIIELLYTIEEHNDQSVCICWWNSLGQIDYYNMRLFAQKTFTVRKNRVYTQQGYKTLSSYGTESMLLCSKFENRETMEWLCEMIASPKVWIKRGDGFMPVEIITDTVVTHSPELSRLQLTLVNSHQRAFQNL